MIFVFIGLTYFTKHSGLHFLVASMMISFLWLSSIPSCICTTFKSHYNLVVIDPNFKTGTPNINVANQ